jgi:hypothetical protein
MNLTLADTKIAKLIFVLIFGFCVNSVAQNTGEGKYTDITAVKGDVLHHIDLLQDVKLVVKKGNGINDLKILLEDGINFRR